MEIHFASSLRQVKALIDIDQIIAISDLAELMIIAFTFMTRSIIITNFIECVIMIWPNFDSKIFLLRAH